MLTMMMFVLIAGFIFLNVMYGVYTAIRDMLERAGIVSPRKRKRDWSDGWVISSGSGGSSGSSWGGGSSGGGFSGGGGSFGGGGSSGSW
jgi:uncharacterized membrane protein YgcG